MEAKVIKNIGSLVEGDILNYDKEEGDFYLEKIEEIKPVNDNIENSSYKKKILRVNISEWFIKNHPDYFILLDDEGNQIVEERICETPEENLTEEKEYKKDSEDVEYLMNYKKSLSEVYENKYKRLEKENEELKKKLKTIESSSFLDMNYYPRRWSLVW